MLRDSVEIANLFNQYFIDVGPSLANRIDSNRHFRDYLRTPSVNQLTLRSIDENKISQVIEHLKNKSSSGVDGIFNNLIGYEPAGLTVHPPPGMIEGGFIFFVWVSSVTKIFSSKKSGFCRRYSHWNAPKRGFTS